MLIDGKPSVIFNRLRNLNDGSCSDDVIKTIFLDQLPPQVRAVIAMSKDNLQDLAQMADKVAEAIGPNTFHVSAVGSRGSPQQSNTSAVTKQRTPFSHEEKINHLTQQLEKLTNQLVKSHSRRSRSKSRNKDNRDRSQDKNSNG